MQEVTIVIPNYNGLHYLTECLRSLAAGTVKTPVIIVDNGSTDGSVGWIRDCCPEVQLISLHENMGFCKAVNIGIKTAETEYVILLNNDTIADPAFVEELLRVIKKDHRIFSAGAKMLNLKSPELIDDAGDFYNALGWAYARGKGAPAAKYNEEIRIFAACAGAAIYRKELLDELGYFDEAHFAYLEDIDIGYRAGISGYYNLFAPHARVRHAGSGASGSRYNHFKTDLTSRNSIYLIYKNMPLFQILINLPFFLIGFGIKFIFFACKGMGLRYLKGLAAGIRLSVGRSGRNHKVRFKWNHFGHYVRVQGQLYLNIYRRFLK